MLKTLEKSEIHAVSLEEVKTHLRLDHPEDDQYLIHLIETGTEYIEEYLNRSLIVQKFCYIGKGIKKSNGLFEIRLPRPNILDVCSLNIIKNGIGRYVIKRYQLLNADSLPKLVLAKEEEDLIEVTYQSGYGYYPKHIPSPIRHALLQLIADFYENRGEESIMRSNLFKTLLSPYRVMEIL